MGVSKDVQTLNSIMRTFMNKVATTYLLRQYQVKVSLYTDAEIMVIE